MNKILDEAFENTVFNELSQEKGSSRTASARSKDSFDKEVERALISFDSLRKADPDAKVHYIDERRVEVSFSKVHLSFSIKSLLGQDNPDIDLEFSDDFVGFVPDGELIKKSALPLWVIKRLKPGIVLIERVA